MKVNVWFIAALGGLFLMLGAGIIAVPIIYMSGVRSFEEVSIPAEGYEIQGYLSKGSKPDGPWVVLTHGNRKSGQAHTLYQRLMHNLTDDVSILAIDFRGFGRSSAEGMLFADRILDRSGDIEAGVAYLKQTYGVEDQQIVLVGHSLGSLQILKAVKGHRYRLLVPIGPANFEVFLTDQERMEDYMTKFERNTGVRLAPDVMVQEGSQLTPQALFSPCPETPVALIVGAYDHGDTLLDHRQEVPEDCQGTIHWITIPLSDHMYGTEDFNLPRPLRTMSSTLSLSLLTWRLNQLVTDAP
jgi:alpha/beta superfamily hydrolase